MSLPLFHSVVELRSPIVFDWQQFLIATGQTCPRHRAILKSRLGWFGRFIPYRVWAVDKDGNDILVSVTHLPKES